MAGPETAGEAKEMPRRLLDAVERGHLSASTPKAQALVRRLEGALLALETLQGEARSGEDG